MELAMVILSSWCTFGFCAWLLTMYVVGDGVAARSKDYLLYLPLSTISGPLAFRVVMRFLNERENTWYSLQK